MSYKLKLVD